MDLEVSLYSFTSHSQLLSFTPHSKPKVKKIVKGSKIQVLHVIFLQENDNVRHTMEIQRVIHIVYMATLILNSMHGFVLLELLTKTLIDPMRILSF